MRFILSLTTIPSKMDHVHRTLQTATLVYN
jgi:hypothetical protein